MSLFALVGLKIAIGHYFYFQRLDGHLDPDDGVSSQQVVKQVGNAFVFLALVYFRASILIAYNQYIWTIFRRNALKVSSINKAFSILSRMLSYLSLQLLWETPFTLALIPWLLFLGGLTHAATLSVVPASYRQVSPGQNCTLDFRTPSWSQLQSMQSDLSLEPTAQMLKVVSEASLNMMITPPPIPALTSTYNIQFYLATRNDPTPQQQADFEYFIDNYAPEANVLRHNKSNRESIQILLMMGGVGDAIGVHALLILSAFSPTVVTINDPYQGITTDDFNNCYDIIYSNDTTYVAYFTSFLILGSNIFGNISLEDDAQGCDRSPESGCLKGNSFFKLQIDTSRVSLTELVACDEIARNYRYDIYDIPANENNFPSGPWMCRNQTLARGIEDIANNLTISMLSSANFLSNTTAQITSYTTQKMYRMISPITDEIYHDGSFFTIMATTMKPDIDAMSQGACLGSTKGIARKKMMFGVLTPGRSPDMNGSTGLSGSHGEAVRHDAFGIEGSVARLRKGDSCL